MAVELPPTLRRDQPLSDATEAYLAEVTSRRSKRSRGAGEIPAAPVEKQPGVKREIKYYRGDLNNVTHKVDVLSCDLPLFALAPTKDIRIYERDGASVKIIPNACGAAHVFDKDLWIYCIGQLVAGKIVKMPGSIDSSSLTFRGTLGLPVEWRTSLVSSA